MPTTDDKPQSGQVEGHIGAIQAQPSDGATRTISSPATAEVRGPSAFMIAVPVLTAEDRRFLRSAMARGRSSSGAPQASQLWKPKARQILLSAATQARPLYGATQASSVFTAEDRQLLQRALAQAEATKAYSVFTAEDRQLLQCALAQAEALAPYDGQLQSRGSKAPQLGQPSTPAARQSTPPASEASRRGQSPMLVDREVSRSRPESPKSRPPIRPSLTFDPLHTLKLSSPSQKTFKVPAKLVK